MNLFDQPKEAAYRAGLRLDRNVNKMLGKYPRMLSHFHYMRGQAEEFISGDQEDQMSLAKFKQSSNPAATPNGNSASNSNLASTPFNENSTPFMPQVSCPSTVLFNLSDNLVFKNGELFSKFFLLCKWTRI